ncbi:MAG: S8 family peptidase [Bryobacteraceae bacterium]
MRADQITTILWKGRNIEVAAGRLLVKVRPGMEEAFIDLVEKAFAKLAEFESQNVPLFGSLARLLLSELPPPKTVWEKLSGNWLLGRLGIERSLQKTIEKLLGQAEALGIEFVEPDPIHRALIAPNDTLFAESWAHQRLRSVEAWQLSDGSDDVRLALVDSGVRMSDGVVAHVDFDPQRFVLADDLVDNLMPPSDESGHGTSIAGILAATRNNGQGVAGMNHTSKVVIYRVFDADDHAVGTRVLEAFRRAVRDSRTANKRLVINYSGGSLATTERFKEGCAELTAQGDVLICCAAGNSGPIHEPGVFAGANPALVCVGSIRSDGTVANASSRGPELTVTAPGVDIKTTTRDGSFDFVSGTSAAAGFVSGIASLVWSRKPTLTAKQVRDILIQSTDRTTHSINRGFGTVDARKALELAGT